MSTCPTEYPSAAVQIAEINQPVELPEFDDDAAAGDWGLYRRRCTFIDVNPAINSADAAALKCRFALTYLGHRAQLRGGVYLRLRPSVFTPSLIEKLAEENTRARYTRYPWLERLMQLLLQLDQDQYAADSQHGNLAKPSRPRQKLQIVPNLLA